MAKSKKNIDAFQKAMLSNTKMIGVKENEDQKNAASPEKQKKIHAESNLYGISPEKFKILDNMGKKYGIDVNILIEKGLDLFISLEDYWFKDNDI